MDKCKKKKLMVVVGAGASIDLGMPSVNEVDCLFSEWAKEDYQLANDENKTLYCHIRDEVNRHYKANPKKGLQKETNFEEILYVILQLSAALGDDNYKLPMNAFWGLKELPKINSSTEEKFVDGNDLRQLCSLLVDKLLTEFRERCKTSKEDNKEKENFDHFTKFINQLSNDYDVAFITLNYDNLISQANPDLFTGFKADGSFDPVSVYEKSDWGLIYHLHGSVHFDMQLEPLNMHAIKWTDLNSAFSGNSSCRNYQDTSEGISMPTSVIVAGYGKTNQIQRVPFRTYYSKIDEIARKADAFLFMGYGFNDFHLNNSLHMIRDGVPSKSIVIIDWAEDNQDPMQFRHDDWANNLCNAIRVNAREMTTKQYSIAPRIKDLKKNEEFEISKNSDYPLSIWYGGFIEACKNYNKIKTELDKNLL